MSRWQLARTAFVLLGVFALPPALSGEEPSAREGSLQFVTRTYHVADLVLPLAPGAGDHAADFETLLDLIELRTGADCWGEAGGGARIVPHPGTLSLVIRQTQPMHDRISELLEEVRGTGDLALAVEMLLIEGDLNACKDPASSRSAEGLVDAVGRARLLEAVQAQKGSSILAAPKLTFFNGQTARMSTVSGEKPTMTTIGVHGVVSKDNRYSRLWLDTTVGEKTNRVEALIPEGHTAVRKLADGQWLMVTSHVINAAEPQVMTAPKPMDASGKKRFPVPMDTSEDAAELVHVPEFNAQAEIFGMTVKLAAAIKTEGAESEAATTDAGEPTLVKGIERVAFQVAQVEPGSGDDEEPPAIVELPEPKTCDASDCRKNQSAATKTVRDLPLPREAESAARIHVYLNDEPEAAGEPMTGFARLNDRTAQIFPNPMPPSHGSPGIQGPFFFSMPGPAPLPGECRNLLYVVPKMGATEGSQNYFQAPPQAFHLELINPPQASSRPDRWVQQVAGERSELGADEHLAAAARELESLGLKVEANVVRTLLQSLAMKAQMRLDQIDDEIARLRQERDRLESLSPTPASGARLELLGTGEAR